MSVVQRPVQRPVKQFPERVLRRPVQQNQTLGGLAGQLGASGFENGIHLDFANNFHYIKQPGQDPQIAAFNSLFTFTRNSSASTFRDSSGLIQYANENQATRSTPTVAQLGVSGNVSDNTSTDWTPVFAKNTQSLSFGDNSLARFAYTNSSIVGGTGSVVTVSCYIFMSSLPVLATLSNDASADLAFIINGGYPTQNTLLAQRVESIAPNIYRCSCTVIQASSGSNNYGIIKNTLHSAKTFIVTGFQVQVGKNVGAYLSTTGSAKFDQPRIEYDVNGNALGLLMEGSRQNICLQSEDFNTTWTTSAAATNATITVNATSAPDGNTTADLMFEDTDTGAHSTIQSITFANATAYTFSVFVKPSGRTWCILQLPSSAFTANAFAYFNLVGSGSVGTTTGSPTATSIQAYANGWYRISISKTSTAAVGGNIFIYTSTGDGVSSFAGDGVSGLYLWGAQVEAGAFASSYIPTTTVAVTRQADIAVKILSTELPSGSEVTVFATGYAPLLDTGSVRYIVCIDNAATTNRVILGRSPTSGFGSYTVTAGGAAQFGTTGSVDWRTLSPIKIAFGLGATSSAGYLNGTSDFTNGVITLPTGMTTIRVGSKFGAADAENWHGHIKTVRVWAERKPNSQLQDLTA